VLVEAAGGGEAGRAMVNVAGMAYVFNARMGIYRMQGGEVQRIGLTVRDTVAGLSLSVADSAYLAGYEPRENAVWFSVRRIGQTRNDRVLVYFLRTEAWSVYDVAVSAMAQVVQPSNGRRALLVGDDRGYFGWVGEGQNDHQFTGVKGGTIQAGSTVTDIVTAGGLSTTDDGLTNLWFVHELADGRLEVRVVDGNTDTVIALTAAASAVVEGNRWWVGAIMLEWASKRFDWGLPMVQKRVRALQVALRDAILDQELTAWLLPDDVKAPVRVSRKAAAAQVRLEYPGTRGGFTLQARLEHIGVEGPLVIRAVQLVTDAMGASEQ